MAGPNADFDAADFRTNIRFVMTMGTPNAVADRATFQWTTPKTYVQQDSANTPFTWTSSPATSTPHADVQVPVAIEGVGNRIGSADQTSVGTFDMTRVIITILDEDYALVEGADKVQLGQNTYLIRFVAPPIALFDVDVIQLHAEAYDES